MKLSEIQQKLKAPKNQFNKFGGYKYRNAEDILEAVKPLLGESVVMLTDSIELVGDRYYVKSTAHFVEEKTGKDSFVSAFARESLEKKGMDTAQITGAASSYARKYALNGLFLIDDTQDADTQDNTEKREPMKSYNVPRKVAAADDEAGGAVIKEDNQFLEKEEIETVQKEQIKDLLGSYGHDQLTKSEAKKIVKELTKLELKPENFEEIIHRLRDGLDTVDPLAKALKS